MQKLAKTSGEPGANAPRTSSHSLAPQDFVDPFKTRAERDRQRKLDGQKHWRTIPAFNAFVANAPAPDPFKKTAGPAPNETPQDTLEIPAVEAVPPASIEAPQPKKTRGRKPVASAAPAVEPETEEVPEMPAGVLAAFAASRGQSGAAIGIGALGLAGAGEAATERVLRADVMDKPRADKATDSDAGEVKTIKPKTPEAGAKPKAEAPKSKTPDLSIPEATATKGMAARFFGPKSPETGKRAASISERGADSVVDDIVVWLIAGVLLLLIGWAFFTYVRPSPHPDVEKVVKPQSISAPAPVLKKAEPFPADEPIDLRPQTVLPAEPVAPIAAPVQATLAPAPAQDSLPLAGSCPSGRVVRSLFCTKSTFLTAEGRAQLEKDVAQWRACGGDRTFVVRGYADTRGSPELNRQLAEGRAASVAAVLKLAGLRAAAPEGVGELADLPDGQNCPNQRRVDVFLGDETPAVSRACTPPDDLAALVCP